jgi:hypothetical protein
VISSAAAVIRRPGRSDGSISTVIPHRHTQAFLRINDDVEGNKVFHYRRPSGRAQISGAALALVLTCTVGCLPAQDDEKAAPSKAPGAPTAEPASNGMAKLSPAEIMTRTRKATDSAAYVRMRAEVTDGGQKYKLDFRFAGKTKATGWFTQGSQRVEITRIGKTIYLSGNKAFWKSAGGTSAVQLLAGKHVKTTAKNSDFKEIAAFTNRTALLTEVLKATSGWKKGKPDKVGGVPTVVLYNGAGDTLQVAAQGRPYALLVEGGLHDRIEYLDYGKPVRIKPPTGPIIDVDALG